MEKKNIETFIKKYNLGGAIEGVVWRNIDNDLSVTAMTSDRKLFATVQYKNGASFVKDVDVDVVIVDTDKLKKMINPLEDNIDISLDIDEKDKKRVRKIIAEDDMLTIFFRTGNLSVIDGVPSMKNIPPFDIEIILVPRCIEIFIQSFSSVSDDQTTFTIVMSKRKQRLELVLGYKQSGSDQMNIGVQITPGSKDTIKNPISFSAKHLKEILIANSDVENPVLKISEAGLASISFDNNGFKSQYYLVKVDVED